MKTKLTSVLKDLGNPQSTDKATMMNMAYNLFKAKDQDDYINNFCAGILVQQAQERAKRLESEKQNMKINDEKDRMTTAMEYWEKYQRTDKPPRVKIETLEPSPAMEAFKAYQRRWGG